MAERHKIIDDVVHGSMKLDSLFLDLMETLEMQRLSGIRQLGLTYLVFPGANHSRIEHSIGVGFIASEIARVLRLRENERDLVAAAGLLHDVGHGPYSHTLEMVLHEKLGVDHMEVTRGIITGRYDIIPEETRKSLEFEKRIPDVLKEHGLNPEEVAELIVGSTAEEQLKLECLPSQDKQCFFNEKRYLGQIIHSAIDADQIDYLLRDSHYTGVAHGTIDVGRLLQTMTIHNNDVVINAKGASAVEGMLVARGLMYSSVYFHKTARIAELMMARAVECALESEMMELQRMIDSELMEWLERVGDFQRYMALCLKYRKLFKKTCTRGLDELTEEQKESLVNISKKGMRKDVEDRICKSAGIPEGHVIVDIPVPEILLSEPRIAKTDVNILQDGKVKPFSRFSPLGGALQRRSVSSWVVMVSTPGKYKERVETVCEKHLFEM